jgi:hypothetical protein
VEARVVDQQRKIRAKRQVRARLRITTRPHGTRTVDFSYLPSIR